MLVMRFVYFLYINSMENTTFFCVETRLEELGNSKVDPSPFRKLTFGNKLANPGETTNYHNDRNSPIGLPHSMPSLG